MIVNEISLDEIYEGCEDLNIKTFFHSKKQNSHEAVLFIGHLMFFSEKLFFNVFIYTPKCF